MKRYSPGGVRALGGGDACGMHAGRVRLKAVGARARAERTMNIWPMCVTLDVSKLSGWLNADACWRVERRGHVRECTTGEVAWGREARGAQGVWGQGVGVAGTSRITGPTQGLGATVHTSNIHRMFVTLDVSNVEGSGWLNPFAICRVKRKVCAAGRCKTFPSFRGL